MFRYLYVPLFVPFRVYVARPYLALKKAPFVSEFPVLFSYLPYPATHSLWDALSEARILICASSVVGPRSTPSRVFLFDSTRIRPF